MKKTLVIVSAIAATTITAGTIAVAKAKKIARAKKAEEIELQKEAATAEPIEESDEGFEPEDTSEPVDLFNNYSKCENETESKLHFKTKEAEETEEDDEAEYVTDYEPAGDLYQITVEYCPRVEDGEEAKTKHDTYLEFMDIVNTGIFVRRNNIDAMSTSASFDWDNHPRLIEEIEDYFSVTEHLEERKKEFVIDFEGYEFSSPIIMGHVGNDPKRSILIRARKVDIEDIF